MADIALEKRAIRRRILAWRGSIPPDQHAAFSDAICRSVLSMDAYLAAQSILFYMPMRGEVDIFNLIRQALRDGKRCALPKCEAGTVLHTYFVRDLAADLQPGTWGILEPKSVPENLCNPGELQVIIVPGAVFDRSGNRLGYGAGYYDRFLAPLDRVVKIAPAFAGQIVPELPVGEWDVSMDTIVTESEIIRCTANRRAPHG